MRKMYCYHSKICDGINLYDDGNICTPEKPIEVFVLTPSELEAREKKAWETARKDTEWKDLYNGPALRCFEDYKNGKEYKQ